MSNRCALAFITSWPSSCLPCNCTEPFCGCSWTLSGGWPTTRVHQSRAGPGCGAPAVGKAVRRSCSTNHRFPAPAPAVGTSSMSTLATFSEPPSCCRGRTDHHTPHELLILAERSPVTHRSAEQLLERRPGSAAENTIEWSSLTRNSRRGRRAGPSRGTACLGSAYPTTQQQRPSNTRRTYGDQSGRLSLTPSVEVGIPRVICRQSPVWASIPTFASRPARTCSPTVALSRRCASKPSSKLRLPRSSTPPPTRCLWPCGRPSRPNGRGCRTIRAASRVPGSSGWRTFRGPGATTRRST